jgi:acetoin utilization deacetylase AcuC-like enzyme
MAIAFISHPDCLLHEMGPVHPESPARLWAINDQLIASRVDSVLRHLDAPQATRGQLERVHDAAYIDMLYRASPQAGMVALDPETLMNPHTLDAALRAAGAALLGVDRVLRGEVEAAFCSVRPPGHHAGRAQAMGGCFLNNVAVAAAQGLAVHGLERIAIVDFDVHHGNGTEDIFRTERRVLFCSIFQHPYYPYHGGDSDSDHIINIPLPAGTRGAAYRQAVETYCLSALDRFRPQLILLSAGFDGHYADDIGQMGLDETDYFWLTQKIKTVADRYAQGRIVSVLEGGYAPQALGRSVAAHLQALLGSGQA